jgi:large subunit ribosomal protein L6
MSRVGKQIIAIPEKTTVSVLNGVVTVKGPLGELSKPLRAAVALTVTDKEISFTPADSSKETRSLWGTYASHLDNMIQGVNKAFEKKLILEGIGYRVQMSGKTLELVVGFSHPVQIPVPEGLTVSVDKNVITITGADKELVGQFTSDVRAVKKPEPYKGKGIRYENEVIRRKQGKKTAA